MKVKKLANVHYFYRRIRRDPTEPFSETKK